MKKKIVLVVGGTGGVGTYIVDAFAKAEYETLFTYCCNQSIAEELERNSCAKGFRLDVTNEDELESLYVQIVEQYGKLDALVYDSGIFEDALVENMDLTSWNRVLSINLTGAFLTIKHMLPLLRKSRNGRILCIGSVMGESGIYGSCSYAASKAGMIGLIKSVALENAKYGVTANVVSFGYIAAGMTNRLTDKILENAIKKIPMKRTGDPADTARVIVDLCADHTNYISGQVIRINGLLYV